MDAHEAIGYALAFVVGAVGVRVLTIGGRKRKKKRK